MDEEPIALANIKQYFRRSKGGKVERVKAHTDSRAARGLMLGAATHTGLMGLALGGSSKSRATSYPQRDPKEAARTEADFGAAADRMHDAGEGVYGQLAQQAGRASYDSMKSANSVMEHVRAARAHSAALTAAPAAQKAHHREMMGRHTARAIENAKANDKANKGTTNELEMVKQQLNPSMPSFQSDDDEDDLTGSEMAAVKALGPEKASMYDSLRAEGMSHAGALAKVTKWDPKKEPRGPGTYVPNSELGPEAEKKAWGIKDTKGDWY